MIEQLGALDPSESPATLADAACQALLDLTGTDAAALLRFVGNDVSVLGQRGGGAVASGTVLPPILGLMVQRRAQAGPWADHTLSETAEAAAMGLSNARVGGSSLR